MEGEGGDVGVDGEGEHGGGGGPRAGPAGGGDGEGQETDAGQYARYNRCDPPKRYSRAGDVRLGGRAGGKAVINQQSFRPGVGGVFLEVVCIDNTHGDECRVYGALSAVGMAGTVKDANNPHINETQSQGCDNRNRLKKQGLRKRCLCGRPPVLDPTAKVDGL